MCLKKEERKRKKQVSSMSFERAVVCRGLAIELRRRRPMCNSSKSRGRDRSTPVSIGARNIHEGSVLLGSNITTTTTTTTTTTATMIDVCWMDEEAKGSSSKRENEEKGAAFLGVYVYAIYSENISTPEPSDISEDDHYSSVLMKDPDKLKLMLLAWNYQMQHQAQQQGGVVPPGLVGPQAAAAAVAAAAQQQLSNGGGIVSNSSSGGTGNGIASALSPANGATAGMGSNGGQTSSTQQQQLNANSPVSSRINVSSVNTSSSGNLTSSTLTDSRNGNSEPNDMSQSVNSASSGSATTPGGAVGPNGEDMATLWANYQISLKKTPPPGSGTPSRDRDRELSPAGEGAGSAHDETSSSGNKEDEDDDDEDVDERLDPRHHDPERLKAFNMFVRLFVDENLDRMTPISKQPKEKIQAIIDSCTRQFPEFAERARKRIRTYLKSCRRNKRGREGASWDAARPTPAHLTSVQAEQILATACENESDNAKRMRVGLEPVSQPMPTLPAATVSIR
ncbi:unnamed protein product [Trichogramma brassicae]|uniref:Nucleolar protein 4 helical domain-containing protein n=1 Tax=Trichogramma brassicae TaxID=86971 RepID=A0A6H5J3T2_9HYME|nr:unnamed protein product [Trichogramma brassicae]